MNHYQRRLDDAIAFALMSESAAQRQILADCLGSKVLSDEAKKASFDYSRWEAESFAALPKVST